MKGPLELSEIGRIADAFFQPHADLSVGEAREKIMQYAGRLTLLYVEDEKSTREAVAGELNGLGFRKVVTAGDGSEGLAAYRKAKGFSVVLTDFDMPGMNGVELIDAICRMQPRQVFMVLSNYQADEFFRRINRGKLIFPGPKIPIARHVNKAQLQTRFWNRFARVCGIACMGLAFEAIETKVGQAGAAAGEGR